MDNLSVKLEAFINELQSQPGINGLLEPIVREKEKVAIKPTKQCLEDRANFQIFRSQISDMAKKHGLELKNGFPELSYVIDIKAFHRDRLKGVFGVTKDQIAESIEYFLTLDYSQLRFEEETKVPRATYFRYKNKLQNQSETEEERKDATIEDKTITSAHS
jgi:hypothetical protein